MLRKSFENIDQRAKIPVGVEFRKEEVWGKVVKASRKDRTRYRYWAAAALIPIIALSIWYFKASTDAEPRYLLTAISSDQSNMVEEIPTSNWEQKPEKTISTATHQEEEFVEKEVWKPITPDSTETLHKNEQSKILRQTIVLEDTFATSEEKKLSPSAQAFQQALEKTKIEKKVEERMIVEKLTFEQMIQARRQFMQEKGNPTKNKRKDD
ncbi:hypothetical protein A33Q_1523 [Indibacter alkaliphilus LW1]|uniref:Uncharacterized protein n=1 Tax=Indibacter alkaliphilus (strain CCUG 57479 / KCTC 22604 / LW1) TaxID=1189612 RepID=S2E0Q1_INDAL|nr:hypothetical protein [Indibacter alkaliphilus]EOZ98016.1 hypothetical protein A33Q_1523 [Indibacter alkaliphilus LW1]